ncbi:unnamed protein product [Brachionus calyciflorus]|uniref:Uncharacterized protein n=1 Tax=Brachionus calyciflorus TaxID=104777 RepID=A0A814AKU0_9BILA|nr:unnamed protein product [Brachionus calyciflorus]
MHRNIIVEYYSTLINEIDLNVEKAINFFKTGETVVNKFNSDRNIIIAKVKEIEKIKLNNFKDSDTIYDGLFCFFIPTKHLIDLKTDSEESEKYSELDLMEFKLQLEAKEEYLKSRYQIGQLVVLNIPLNKKIVEKLIIGDFFIDQNENYFQELLKLKVLTELIQSNRDDLIIDLTNIENNQIEKLDLIKDYQVLNENSLSCISSLLNLKSIKEIKFRRGSITEIPDNFFIKFKNLKKLNLKFLENLKEDVFNGLENLEILKIYDSFSLNPEANALEKLTNLKKLILFKGTIKNIAFLNNLKSLKKLVIKKCNFELFEMKSLNGLTSLESLRLFKNKFKQIEKNNFEGFKNLKSLESDYEPEIFTKNSPLEILSLKSLINHNNFKSLKFLNIRDFNLFSDFNFLNGLNELEFLDLEVPDNLTRSFETVDLSKLKFLVLTCQNIYLNESLKNLQGLELIGSKLFSPNQFVNLVNLDYLSVSYSDFVINKDSLASLLVLKNMKYFKFEQNIYSNLIADREHTLLRVLLNLFQEPNDVMIKISQDYVSIEVLEFCLISEKVYFKHYLQVSECVREFILSSESFYVRESFRNVKTRRSNFLLEFENIGEDSDDEIVSFTNEINEFF